MHSIRYRPEIDGLRAVAVAAVIGFHAGFPGFSGGYVGVDVFFVISGYLITRIIHREMQAETFSLGRFYARRARRILPALFLVCLCCIPFALVLMNSSQLRDFGQSLVGALTFSSNLLFWIESGYFERASEAKPLLHTWSLAIEEQFYIGFPILLLLLRGRSRATVMAVLALISLASLAASHFGARIAPTANFYLLPSRIWELGAGAVLALAMEGRSVRQPAIRQIGSALGLLLIVGAVVGFDRSTPFPSLYAIVPVAGAALIVACSGQGDLAGRLLGCRPFVWGGLISYSLYLWHFPVFAFARLGRFEAPGWPVFAGLAALCVPLAWLSWKFVETPFRRGAVVLTRRDWTALAAALAAILAPAVLAMQVSTQIENLRLTDAQREIVPYRNYDYRAMFGGCFLSHTEGRGPWPESCLTPPADGDAILLWGDSHAAGLSYGLRRLHPATLVATASGCPPFANAAIRERPNCAALNSRVLDEISRQRPAAVILHARWGHYLEVYDESLLTETIAEVRSRSPDSAIYVVGGVPMWAGGLPNLLVRRNIGVWPQRYLVPPGIDPVIEADRRLQNLAGEASAPFISLLDVLCRGRSCAQSVQVDGKAELTTFDYGHLTKAGSLFAAGHVLRQIEAAGAPPDAGDPQ